jgi:predicted aspartyl protease
VFKGLAAAFGLLSLAPGTRAAPAVPLVETAAGPAIRVRIGEAEPALFLLDLGSNLTLVRDALARRLGLEARGWLPLESLAGSETVAWTRLASLEVGGVRLREVEAAFAPLAGVRAVAPEIQGVLGQTALTGIAYALDHARRRFEIAGPRSGPCVSTELNEGRVVVRVAAGRAGQPLALVLDSAASQLVLYGRAASQVVPRGTRFLETDHGRRPVAAGRLDRLSVGDVELRGVDAVMLPWAAERSEDGLLPTRLFARVAVDSAAGCAGFEALR